MRVMMSNSATVTAANIALSVLVLSLLLAYVVFIFVYLCKADREKLDW